MSEAPDGALSPGLALNRDWPFFHDAPMTQSDRAATNMLSYSGVTLKKVRYQIGMASRPRRMKDKKPAATPVKRLSDI
ncbi:MAG: hypothetical protein ABSA13_13985 [Beijerinckiaceae bacterium]